MVHDLFPLLAISGIGFGRTFHFFATVIHERFPLWIGVSTRHILPNKDSHPVTIGVPPGRLYLYVLTDQIEAELFCFLHVIQHCFVRWRSIQPVGPPSLVERTKMKNVFVVELKTHETVFIPLGRYLTHGSIRFYTVGFLTIIIQHYFEVIEVRVVGIP